MATILNDLVVVTVTVRFVASCVPSTTVIKPTVAGDRSTGVTKTSRGTTPRPCAMVCAEPVPVWTVLTKTLRTLSSGVAGIAVLLQSEKRPTALDGRSLGALRCVTRSGLDDDLDREVRVQRLVAP